MTARLVRTLATVAVAAPLAILMASLAILCWRWGTLDLWGLPVHEDGRRTFGDTVLYFEHATRELPIDLLLGLTTGAAAYYAFPAPARPRPRMDGRDKALVAAAVAVAALILAGAAGRCGAACVADNLSQLHTRPGADLVWGSHWRYHLLERLPMILSALSLAGFLRVLTGRGGDPLGRYGLRLGFVGLAAYLLLTAVFTRGLPELLLPFQDARYLGHEAREIVTHAAVTLPLAAGGCLLLQGAWSVPEHRRPFGAGALLWPAALGLTAVGLALYAVWGAVNSSAISQGQSSDLVTLVFPHFFEHSLGYILTPLVAAATYGVCRAVEPNRTPSPPTSRSPS